MREGHAEQREHEDDAAAEHGQPASSPLAREHAEWQLEQAAGQQRHRGQQPDLPVAQPQVVPDKRERRSLGTVNQLVGEFDRERDGEDGKSRPSASSETHTGHATPKGSRPQRIAPRPAALIRPRRVAFCENRPVLADRGAW